MVEADKQMGLQLGWPVWPLLKEKWRASSALSLHRDLRGAVQTDIDFRFGGFPPEQGPVRLAHGKLDFGFEFRHEGGYTALDRSDSAQRAEFYFGCRLGHRGAYPVQAVLIQLDSEYERAILATVEAPLAPTPVDRYFMISGMQARLVPRTELSFQEVGHNHDDAAFARAQIWAITRQLGYHHTSSTFQPWRHNPLQLFADIKRAQQSNPTTSTF